MPFIFDINFYYKSSSTATTTEVCSFYTFLKLWSFQFPHYKRIEFFDLSFHYIKEKNCKNYPELKILRNGYDSITTISVVSYT